MDAERFCDFGLGLFFPASIAGALSRLDRVADLGTLSFSFGFRTPRFLGSVARAIAHCFAQLDERRRNPRIHLANPGLQPLQTVKGKEEVARFKLRANISDMQCDAV